MKARPDSIVTFVVLISQRPFILPVMRTTITRGFATMTIAVGLTACSAEAPAARLPITSAPVHAPEPAEIPSAARSPTPTKAPLKLPGTRGKCRVGCDTVKARDYNGDGYADLAIGAPGPWWEGKPSTVSGYVIISFGRADGLTTRRQKLLQPEQAGQPGGLRPMAAVSACRPPAAISIATDTPI